MPPYPILSANLSEKFAPISAKLQYHPSARKTDIGCKSTIVSAALPTLWMMQRMQGKFKQLTRTDKESANRWADQFNQADIMQNAFWAYS